MEKIMPLQLLGINHKTAALDTRESIAVLPHEYYATLESICEHTGICEIFILSTCNRTEFYFLAGDRQLFQQWLCQHYQLEESFIDEYFYHYDEQNAIKHLLKVASGLDSMLIGETQILGQLKSAYQQAKSSFYFGSSLDSLLQYTFRIAKKLRHQADFYQYSISIASVAAKIALQFIEKNEQANVLLIGSSKTNQDVCDVLSLHEEINLYIANRSLANAEHIATQYGANVIDINHIELALAKMDVVISATNCPRQILSCQQVQHACQQRSCCLIDLAVPHDIEQSVKALSNIKYYNMDSIGSITAENFAKRSEHAKTLMVDIEKYAEQYFVQSQQWGKTKAICDYRKKIQQICQQEIAYALKKAKKGMTMEQALCLLGHRLSRKVMHYPSNKLNRLELADDQALTQALSHLFDL